MCERRKKHITYYIYIKNSCNCEAKEGSCEKTTRSIRKKLCKKSREKWYEGEKLYEDKF